MANANITGNGTVILNTPLWAGVGNDDTNWQQTPLGTNTATGTISMAIVEVELTASNAATTYDLALATNAVSGTEVIAVLDGFNATTAAGRMAQGDHTSTLIEFAADAGVVAEDKFRIAFLYR
jgi:hypothetical protein